jgi:hypothetical protein
MDVSVGTLSNLSVHEVPTPPSAALDLILRLMLEGRLPDGHMVIYAPLLLLIWRDFDFYVIKAYLSVAGGNQC